NVVPLGSTWISWTPSSSTPATMIDAPNGRTAYIVNSWRYSDKFRESVTRSMGSSYTRRWRCAATRSWSSSVVTSPLYPLPVAPPAVAFHRRSNRRLRELPCLIERELLAESLLEDAVRDRRAAPRGHEVLRGDRAAHVARVHVRTLVVHARDDELDVERVVALHRRVDDVRNQFRALLDGQRVAATQREEPALGFREVHEVLGVRHRTGDRHGGA